MVAAVAVVEAAVAAVGVAAAAVGAAVEEASRNQPQLHLASETGTEGSRAIPQPFLMATVAKATNS